MRLQFLDKISTNHAGHAITRRERLSHFTWSWFECTMSTGALATLLSQQPYTFPGLKTIGKIVLILDLFLFLSFTALIAFRFVTNRSSLSRSLHHPHESFFFGTFWVSLAFIVYNIQAYGVSECGPWLVTALEVLFWTYAGCVMLVAIFQYHVIFEVNQLPIHEMMPAWILPVYPFLVLGPLAGTLLKSQPKPSSAMAILFGGISFQGLGWCFAFMQYTLYITRLTSGLLPSEGKRPGMFVAVGPAAYTSQALILLGMQAESILPDDFLGSTVPVSAIWKATGVAAGLFLWLLGFWFSAISLVGFADGFKSSHFTLNWWALIFPNAGLTIALIEIGDVLGSDGIKGVCSVVTVVLCAVWIAVALGNVRAVYRGDILWTGMDEDMEDVEGDEHEE